MRHASRQSTPKQHAREAAVPAPHSRRLQSEDDSIGANLRLFVLSLIVIGVACSRGDEPFGSLRALQPGTKAPSIQSTIETEPEPTAPAQEAAGDLLLTPTPDPVRQPPTRQALPEWYVVQPGDSLNRIAGAFGVGSQQILAANGLVNPDFLAVGQVLQVPTPFPQDPSPSLKIVPNSELVYGPGSADFDVQQEVERWQGALHSYRELADGRERSGAEIVALVAANHSISPRLLLAILEYQSGWLTRPDPPSERAIYPMGYTRYGSEGLYRQLMWAADELNHGYYLWRAGWVGPYILVDGTAVPPGAGINAGTVAVQFLFGQLYPVEIWRSVIGEAGFPRVYEILFGNPFARGTDPLLPEDLEQPELQLPIEPDRSWSFTGGPHAAWGNWAAWASLDFAPPGDALGCVLSNEWVVAAADGMVVRSDYGIVIQDLDGDGFEGTGWTLQYLHIETRDRVAEGTYLKAGDRIGHPSCEGGVSSGTHLHFSRKYNGEWIPADGDLPFELDGWLSSGWGSAYDGTLTRGFRVLEACACRAAGNQINR